MRRPLASTRALSIFDSAIREVRKDVGDGWRDGRLNESKDAETVGSLLKNKNDGGHSNINVRYSDFDCPTIQCHSEKRRLSTNLSILKSELAFTRFFLHSTTFQLKEITFAQVKTIFGDAGTTRILCGH